MNDSSRLTRAAEALALALDTLGDALAHPRPDAIAAGGAAVEAATLAFRAAAADEGAAAGASAAETALVIAGALGRCRRLGLSLSLLAGPAATLSDAPRGYTPVGRPTCAADGASFLTARG